MAAERKRSIRREHSDGAGPAPAGKPRPRPVSPSPDVRLEIRDAREIRPELLEFFPYEFPGSPATVEISTDEFTAVCPWSGLPDFGTVTVRYLPRARVLELRAFKYYLLSYRNVGVYQEHAANRILSDLVRVTSPKWMDLELDYRVRGGVHTVVRVRWPT
ncbi:MAG TPA: preQ(1) synthase [bacterium]|nr:preQ(1) synthase [bacterium]